jgi:hypothetical protein
MRALFSFVVAVVLLSAASQAQIRLQEDFETSDSTHLPLGWSTWNMAGFLPNDSLALWTVQDTGLTIPGIVTTRLTVARSGSKAIRVSWVAGVDTNGALLTADDWLITRRITNVAVGDSLRFWAIGGNGGTTGQYYPDTLEIWLGDGDSLPSSQALQLATLTWRNGTSTYGVFQKYTFNVSDAAGLNLYVGFRYHINVSVDGYVVFLDDVQVAGPLTDVHPSPLSNLPEDLTLAQNYPNPFNPSTTIVWTVPRDSRVVLKIFNLLGQEVGILVDASMEPGVYRTTWNASNFPAGAYFYRLQVGNELITRKLVLAK